MMYRVIECNNKANLVMASQSQPFHSPPPIHFSATWNTLLSPHPFIPIIFKKGEKMMKKKVNGGVTFSDGF